MKKQNAYFITVNGVTLTPVTLPQIFDMVGKKVAIYTGDEDGVKIVEIRRVRPGSEPVKYADVDFGAGRDRDSATVWLSPGRDDVSVYHLPSNKTDLKAITPLTDQELRREFYKFSRKVMRQMNIHLALIDMGSAWNGTEWSIEIAMNGMIFQSEDGTMSTYEVREFMRTYKFKGGR